MAHPEQRPTRLNNTQADKRPGITQVRRFPELWLAMALLVIAGLTCTANTYDNPFIFDDVDAIVDNPRIRTLSPASIFGQDPVNTPLSGRPTATLSFALNHALGGLDVRGYHLINNLIHILAALTLFGLVRRTLLLPCFAPRFSKDATGYALAVALLWTVHPLQTAAVTYIVARTESLMGLCYLLTVYCAVRGFQAARPGKWYAAAVTACALGAGSKEVIVSAPLLVLVYDVLFGQQSWTGALRRRKGLYFALASTWVVILANQLHLPHAGGIRFDIPGLSPFDYLLTQVTVLVHYLRLSLWPAPLVLDSQDWPLADALTPDFILSLALILTLCAATVAGLRHRAWWSFAGIWFFAILAPTSSVIPLLGEIVDERRMYLPLAAVIVLLVFGGDALGRRIAAALSWRSNAARSALLAILTIATLLFGAMTWARNLDYRSGMTIWTDTVNKRPNNPRAREGLGKELMKEGRFAEAADQFRTALGLSPPGQAPEDVAEFYSALGAALAETGDFSEAIRMHRRSIDLMGSKALMHHRLGNTFLRANDLPNAAQAFQEATRLAPDYYPAHGNLAMILMQMGDLRGAEKHLQVVIRLSPDQGPALAMLANLRMAQGRAEEARALEMEAYRLEAGEERRQ